MAKNLTDATGAAVEHGTPSGNAGHNRENIDKTLRNCRDQMLEIREARRGLNERASDIRTRVKELGVDTRIFDQNVRIYEMESEARAKHMDDFRLCYEAMNTDDQMDWVAVTKQADGSGQAAAE